MPVMTYRAQVLQFLRCQPTKRATFAELQDHTGTRHEQLDRILFSLASDWLINIKGDTYTLTEGGAR